MIYERLASAEMRKRKAKEIYDNYIYVELLAMNTDVICGWVWSFLGGNYLYLVVFGGSGKYVVGIGMVNILWTWSLFEGFGCGFMNSSCYQVIFFKSYIFLLTLRLLLLAGT